MIISHRHRFAFFRVPKTGSTTVELMLRMCGGIDDRDIYTKMPLLGLPESKHLPDAIKGVPDTSKIFVEINHATPTDAIEWEILTEKQLKEYRCFAFLRNPFDRVVSAHAHNAGPFLMTEIFRTEIRRRTDLGLITRLSHEYFYHERVRVCEPLQFSDFRNEVNKMIQYIGGHEFTVMPRINKSRGRDKDITTMEHFDTETEAITRDMFAPDFALFKELGPKHDSPS